MTKRSLNIAVTIGDPAGIGPEIVARLFAGYAPEGSRAVLVGAPSAYGPWLEQAGLDAPVLSDASEVARLGPAEPAVVILDTGITDEFFIGRESAGGGKHAGRAIELACELAENRSVAGIVTAPISKKSLNLGDFQYPGHTEMLARYLNSPRCQMMMVHEGLRVVPLTRHLPIRDVAEHVTGDSIMTCIRETHAGLVSAFGIPAPRIAVAGLNPHAGDGGVIGTEDDEIVAPALETLRSEGIDVSGPHPADSMFQAAAEALGADAAEKTGAASAPQGYDAYVSMYHDQGLVPFKMLAQRRGVNVTIGLPVIRTSVDHGSAYDIAGRGVAQTDSLLAAYQLAEAVAARTV
jgi:4-hydroxythreonine-4-phosphate dehydrogenase